jgi:hypothetical protein
MRWLPYVSFSILLVACGQAATPTPAAPPPAASPTTAPGPASPASSEPSLAPPPPAECQALVAHGNANPACGAEPSATREALAAALESTDSVARDAALAALEACPELAPGVVRGLRAEFAPVACGDAVVGELPTSEADELAPPIRDALLGLALAAKLNRLVRNPPQLSPPFDKARFDEFMKGELAQWILNQAHAIQELAEAGAKLEGYGKGVVAVEAGMADMRFVEVVRTIPVPESIASDPELRDVYYGSLDQALEPRKQRGRDAALVGLKLLAEEGVLEDQRLDRSRALLSKLYNGRRIDALDALILPESAPPAPSNVTQRLAAALPTFYASVVLREEDPGDPGLLQALLQQGLPATHRAKLDAENLSPQARLLVAGALFHSGQLYWRAADFKQVGAFLASPIPGKEADAAKLLGAVAEALQGGPADAAQMMAKGPAAAGTQDVSKLDRLALLGGPQAGAAAFDAALILQLAPPEQDAKAFWRDLQQRYQRAAMRLAGAQKQQALDAASAASETLKAIQ